MAVSPRRLRAKVQKVSGLTALVAATTIALTVPAAPHLPAQAGEAEVHLLLARADGLAREVDVAVTRFTASAGDDGSSLGSRLHQRLDVFQEALADTREAALMGTTAELAGLASLEASGGSAVAGDLTRAALNAAADPKLAAARDHALEVHTLSLHLYDTMLAATEELLRGYAARRGDDDASGQVDAVMSLSHALRETVRQAAITASDQPDEGVEPTFDKLRELAERAWRAGWAFTQSHSALVALPPRSIADICDDPASAACIQGWSAPEVDPRVAEILEALGDGELAVAQTYADLYNVFLPASARSLLLQLIGMEQDSMDVATPSMA